MKPILIREEERHLAIHIEPSLLLEKGCDFTLIPWCLTAFGFQLTSSIVRGLTATRRRRTARFEVSACG